MMITENMASQKISGDCSNSDAYLQASLPNEGDLDLYTGQSFAYSSKPSIGQWMEENQESEEQETNVATQSEDKNVNPKVLQSKNSNGNKRVYDCPVCHKRFGAPSKLKRHCLIHTNKRPFQCSICCRAFRERSHLKVHIRTHTNPVKQRISSLQSYRDNSVPCNQASKSQLKPSAKQVTAQDDTSSTNKQESTVHQDRKMITGNNMASQKKRGDCSDSDMYLQDSLLNEGGLDLHTGQSSAYSSKLSEGQFIEENQEFEEEQEASVATQSEDNDLSVKVLQSNNYNGRKRVYECPVCHKRFVAPSKLKRHSLIHTNQKPFQCSICSSAFRERSHLKVHLRTHTNPVTQKTSTLQSYKDSSLPCTRASKSRFKPSPKQPAAQSDTSSTDKQKSTVHQDQHMVTENMASHRTSGHCSDSDVCLQDSLCNEGGLDLHSGQSSVYSSKSSEGQWMDEIQESEEQEANVTIHSKDKDVNPNVLPSKNSKRNKRVYDCPVCHKRFGAPSKLKRHSLIHTNQRPFQCSMCCSAFRERSHLKVHIRTHTKPVKRRASSLQSYRDNSFPCTRASKSRLKPSPKQPTAQNDTSSTDKQKASVHQDLNMVIENMAPQKTSGDCSNSDVCLQDSLLNEGRLDLHSGQSSVYSSKPSKGRWMEEIEESEEEQVASVTIHSEDKDLNPKVLPSKNSKRNKRVYDCPVCHKLFAAPSKLKRHSLIHTNQRPFQCSMCCSAFRERSHLKVHLRTHTNPVKQRTSSLRSYKDNKVPCKQASKSRFKPAPNQPTAQNDTSSTDKQKSKVHQDLNMVKENMASQKMSVDCSNSNECLQDSLLNEGGLDLYSGRSSVYSSKPSEGQWMEEIQESEEKQEASVTTQSENMDVNVKVWQSKNSNRSKRVHECPVCLKRFGAPSKLKRHSLIHTNQRPFKCSMCCSAFRERSHLKVHLRTHTNPVKQRTSSLWSYKDNNVLCKRASKSRFKPAPKQPTAQNDTSSTDKQKSKVHQDLNMVKENMASQKMSGDCSNSNECLQDSLLNEGGLDLYSGRSSVYSSKPSEGQWMEEIQESEEKQEASVTTQSENMDVNVKVWQSKNSNRSKRVHECPVCLKRFGAPSKLKRHSLIHTNQRPFKCSMCCSAFRERSHLKVHLRTHTNPVKQRTSSLWSYKDNNVLCKRASKSRFKPAPKQPTAQNDTSSTDKQKSKVHQDLNMVIESMASQKMSGDCSNSNVCLQDSLLNEGGLDLYSGQSSVYSSKPSEGQWMEEIQESEEKQEASVTTQSENMDVNVKVWQSKNSNRSKRVHECPVCHKRFGAPSKLKRHFLIHTNQRPFQCSMCCSAFRERSHLKVHLRTHTNPVKQRTSSLRSYKDNKVPCKRASKSRFKPSPKQPTAQNDTSSTDKLKSKVHQDLNMVTENMASQKMSGDCSDSDVCLQGSLLNEECFDPHSGQTSVYSSKPSEDQWMEEIQESDEEQETSVTTQSENIDVNVKVWQSKNSNRSKRVHECPVCHKRFGAPSKLKRHCLIHTNQRPFQCPICCSAFRERSHLKVHIRTMHKDQNMVTEDILSQKMSVDCSDSDLYYSKSTSPLETLENKSEVVFQCNNKSVWDLMHKTDILLDGKKTSDIVPFGRVSDCPPKTDSSLHHCASESRTEENWPHPMDDIEDCVPDSSLSSSGFQQKPDVPTLPEVVVELEDFDPGECFPNPPHDLPVCPDCSQCFPSVRDLYAHNCANRYPEGKIKKSHQCDICLKIFSAPSKLKRHWVTHTGQRQFQCTRCQKSFTQPHHLKTHMQSHW
ncbi:uncharacterized protein znf770 [Garra rufa]|uniref:uncharacterized protein znf770 n=1 Tax=Garra rufa TaxID=137080 RepID=UPI003CCE798A